MKFVWVSIRIVAFGVIGRALSDAGHRYDTGLFWLVMGLVTVVAVASFLEGAE